MHTNREMAHRSGYVNIIGKPNVGKSTLMNAMVGEKLSIITSRAQTTRHRIHGILNSDDYQIIFSDTPGILDPSYKLQEAMLKSARSALVDADVLIYLTEIGEIPDPENVFIQKLSLAKVPVLLVINKIDLAPLVGANLEVMASDTNRMRGDRPYVFTNLKAGEGVRQIARFIIEAGGLDDRLSDQSTTYVQGAVAP